MRRSAPLALTLLAAGSAAARDRSIEDLLARMTVEEKAGQLTQFSAGEPTGPGTGRTAYEAMIVAGQVGSFLNVTSAAQANAYQRLAVEQTRLHIPLLFAFDVIHGFRTVYPINLGLAATWDVPLVEALSRLAAEEATAQGIRWTFSPMVDIARDARWGRIAEGAGEDPYLGARLAEAYVRGYQNRRLDQPTAMLACAKHFAGYGAAEAGRDYNTTEISERTLRQVYLPPFEAAARAGAFTFMAGFNALGGIPATVNAWLLGQILRREWGFGGIVVSDWTAIAETMSHGTASSPAEAARAAILAGVDVDMESGLYLAELPRLVASGQVPVARVDEAVRRVLTAKLALGLFAHPYAPGTDDADPLPSGALALARQAAEESFVLLQNQPVHGVPLLPLDCQRRQTIALVGPLADSPTDMLGAWSGRGRAADVVTLRAALEARAAESNLVVRYARGIAAGPLRGSLHAPFDGGPADQAALDEALRVARQADVVIVAVGEQAERTGEAASRAYLDLDGQQHHLLARLLATGKPVVLLLFSGRPLTLTWAADRVPAMLAAWFPGVQAGPALVRVLCGDVNPSGHLTATFPRTVGQLPLYYDALPTGRPLPAHTEAAPDRFTSRYIDELNRPLFPFGHGLSYTEIRYSPVAVSTARLSAAAVARRGAKLTVSATVTNVGSRSGTAVPQCYIRLRGTSVSRPVRELRGFRRVPLAPGQEERVEFTLGKDELDFWSSAMQLTVEPASLEVWIAPDAVSGTPAQVTLGR